MCMSITEAQEMYSNVRLTKHTIRRLDSKGQYRDSYDTIINRLLDRVENRELPDGEGSF
jgi:hypothetical protein